MIYCYGSLSLCSAVLLLASCRARCGPELRLRHRQQCCACPLRICMLKYVVRVLVLFPDYVGVPLALLGDACGLCLNTTNGGFWECAPAPAHDFFDQHRLSQRDLTPIEHAVVVDAMDDVHPAVKLSGSGRDKTLDGLFAVAFIPVHTEDEFQHRLHVVLVLQLVLPRAAVVVFIHMMSPVVLVLLFFLWCVIFAAFAAVR